MARHGSLPPPPTLSTLASKGSVALFLDFDGTLVEIAPEPDAIHVPDDFSRRLERLSERLNGRLALVSGRSLDDLARHIGAVAVARAGSHGAHRVLSDGAVAGAVPEPLPDAVIQELRTFADEHKLHYETKTHGGALHYRSRPDAEHIVQTFARDVAARAGLTVKRGKAVAELVHPGADKAGAVRTFMGHPLFAGSTPIFVGDDVTDEDGFAGAIEFGGFGLAVGDRISEKARYHLDSVSAVHDWLDL